MWDPSVFARGSASDDEDFSPSPVDLFVADRLAALKGALMSFAVAFARDPCGAVSAASS